MSRPETSANHTVYTQSLPLERYTVGWICALPCELTAARAMLDHRHVRPKNQSKHDENNYTLGSIAGHNIAIVCLPEYGTNNAAIAAKSMQATFPNIRFGLLVGVGGGVPGPITETGPANDIRLGDVVVSLPAGQGGGVIQYDLIRREVDGFRRVGLLNKPPTLLRTAVASLRAERRLGRQLTGLIEDAFAPDDECCEDKCDDDEESEGERWTYPSTGRDFLFSPGYKHRSSGADDCTKCMEAKSAGDIITRRPRKTTHPKIHYGNIGSGNSLIKNGLERDKLAQRDSIICFEMEAAGLMDDFPCLVIRGISDYADSHKNSSWQPYAAAAAAAYAKQLVCSITPQDIDSLAPIQGSLDMTARHPDLENCHWTMLSVDLDLPFARNPRFMGRQDVLSQIQEYFSKDATAPRTLLLYGIGGIGKTQIAAHYAHTMTKDSLAICWVDARDRSSVELGLSCIAQCVLRSLIVHYGERVAATMFGFSDVTSLLLHGPIPPRTMQGAIRSLKSWLGKKSNSRWLIVFDNYDNIDEFNIEDYIPNADHSRILITSRRPDLQRSVDKAFDISGLDDAAALQLLLSGNRMYKADDTPTCPSVQAVLRKLCNFPLAIVQANAYINNRRLSMDDFLQQYEQQFIRPMSQKPRGPWNYDQVVNTTWEVSLSAIQAENKLAAETMFTCSLLGNTNILPEWMQICIPGIVDCIETQHLHLDDACRLHSLLSGFLDKHGKAASAICLKTLDIGRYLAMPAPLLLLFCSELSTCLAWSGWWAFSQILSIFTRQLLCQTQEGIIQTGHLYYSALYALSKGRLEKAEGDCRKLLLVLEKMETTEDLTGSFIKAQMLLARIMTRYKDSPKSKYGYKLACKLVRLIVSAKLYTEYPELLGQVAEYGQMLLSRGDTEGARIHYSNTIHLMMNSGAPKAMTFLWLGKYCGLLFQLGYYPEVEAYLRWMLNESLDTTRKCAILQNLSLLLTHQKKYGELELVARQLLDLERDDISNGGDDGQIIFPTVSLCTALLETKRSTEATVIANESFHLLRKNLGAQNHNIVMLEVFLRKLRKVNQKTQLI
ncbi:purine or other phosphorylase family 1 [Aspergillus oryzae]|uniref:Purine or other phosphorylase family 1 n=1 Tax=Aspergillus oryzae TaxID=5062 RepID=A0A1S9DT39_ASPOZ|nr:purine or other phosphorylase family 1 [Aspergillus oryzae]